MFPALVLGGVLLLMIVGVATVLAHVRTRTPYGGTPPAVREVMVRIARLQQRETVFDIGAGDGRLLIAAKRACPGIRAVGYENAPAIWILGKIRTFLSGQKITLRCRDARRDSLGSADVIFLYLGSEMMRDLQEKFDRELRQGTRVISHSFRFPNKQPERIEEVPYRGRMKKVLLYRW